ncbi:hypothetical protein CTEN210_07791 [Chaetoceros tenuissimus]|uniref:Aromatic amino acid beta-eliminating lyase/threonine aldolase domain-containing protein n=1 Tax=Chaetoceros tenuissimus TaxID=426638 RepID=A0AAD3CUU0_9STRA|nr:hypothetical protein CTEN210_07791 [Chaetoceros tenuissimus]
MVYEKFLFFLFQCFSIATAFASNHISSTPQKAKSISLSSNDNDLAQNEPEEKTVDDFIDLQSQHFPRNPSDMFLQLSKACDELGIDAFDVYGDFAEESKTNSYLRKFESEVADLFGKEDAVFMPSGTMAQGIALKIHSKTDGRNSYEPRFFCHHTSHLRLWEEDGHKELLGINAVEIDTRSSDFHVEPLRLKDLENSIREERTKLNHCNIEYENLSQTGLSTLILELPHRELGGKLTPFEDIEAMKLLCEKEKIKFHCDGARIFEASAGYNMSLKDMAAPFDSVYISFYKGLGAITGAMLMGSKDFCDEARVWLMRFGGNLYTLAPYAVSSMAGFRRHVLLQANKGSDAEILSFERKFKILQHLVHRIKTETKFDSYGSFDPRAPETNMIHIYLKADCDDCINARDKVKEELGCLLFSRIKKVPDSSVAYSMGYRSYFEWTLGEANASISSDVFVETWNSFISKLEEL